MKNIDISALNPIEHGTIETILSCYRSHCQYVKKAGVYGEENGPLDPHREALLSLKAELSVPISCYIDDTGHFNAVEFNICYNQMMYLLMAHGVDQGLLDIGIGDLEEFKQRMLSDILILELNNKFRQALCSEKLYGTVSIHKCVLKRNLYIIKTSCQFFDEKGGEQYGDVTAAILKKAA